MLLPIFDLPIFLLVYISLSLSASARPSSASEWASGTSPTRTTTPWSSRSSATRNQFVVKTFEFHDFDEHKLDFFSINATNGEWNVKCYFIVQTLETLLYLKYRPAQCKYSAHLLHSVIGSVIPRLPVGWLVVRSVIISEKGMDVTLPSLLSEHCWLLYTSIFAIKIKNILSTLNYNFTVYNNKSVCVFRLIQTLGKFFF